MPIPPDQSLADLLRDSGVVYGLNHEAIKQAESNRKSGYEFKHPLVIAQGTAARKGMKGLHPRFTPTSLHIVTLNAEGQNESEEILLYPLVHAGEILASQAPPSLPEPGMNIFGQVVKCSSPQELDIVAGEHATPDKAGEHLLAVVTGYPSLRAIRKGGIEQQHLGIEALIQISPDKMQAILHLKPAPPGHPLPSQEEIEEVLAGMKVVHGGLPKSINLCLRHCREEQRPQTQVIAIGTLPVRGEDARLEFVMEIGPLPGKVMANGDIDYRERNMFVGVNKGQVIAVRVPPTTGSPGSDVFGKSIAQTKGSDLKVKVADDAAYDDATGEIRALHSGVLSLVSETTVKVCSRQVISQDVDFNTGNIVSRDALEIRGSILPKFRVNALGDILIRGNIEKAQARSDANVVVQRGVIGETAVIRCRGEVDVQFVEGGLIVAGGAILLRKSGYYCQLHSGGNINAPPEARILASQVVAAGSLVLGNVGSENAESSLIAAAVVPEQLQKMQGLKQEEKVRWDALERLQRRIGPDAKSGELEQLQHAYNEIHRALIALNLITTINDPGSDRGLSHALECSIVIKGTIHAGSEIRIGNSTMIVPLSMSNVCFRLSEQIAPGATSRDIVGIPIHA